MVAGLDEIRRKLGGRTDGRTDGQWLLALSVVLCALACHGDRNPEGAGGPVRQSVGRSVRQVDSILPIAEEIRRFREQVPETPSRLSGGAGSRDELVRRWVHAIESRDSIALRGMLLDAAEYITFYYPESPYTHAPYRQSPGVRWSLITSTSSQGAARVWSRHAGLPMGFTGYRCNPKPEIMGRNQVWTGCVVEWKNGPEHGTIRLFGPIIERDGEFKFVTYASDY